MRTGILIGTVVSGLACGGWAASPSHLSPEAIAALPAVGGAWRPEGLGQAAWQDAVDAWSCAAARGEVSRETLAVIDLTLPSDRARLWVVDLQAQSVLLHVRVSHGSGSGLRYASSFSNEEGSHATSLGLYRASETYQGKHGRSLKLDGLEPSNAAARSRSVVVHAADYMTDAFVAKNGRAGRSWGCPAVDPGVSDALIDALEGGGALYAWHGGDPWRSSSPLLSCPERPAR